jgi:hypothetical protein
MRQNVGILKYQQYLSQSAAEILKQMTELKQLREAVNLAEVAKGAQQSEELARRPVDPKVIDPFAGSQLRV